MKRFAYAGLALLFAAFTAASSMASEKGHAHWSYEGDTAPGQWGHMSKDYEACSKGKSQSPIDISGATDEDLPDIAFSYKPSKLNMENNGHTIQVNYDKGSSIKVDGGDYELVQFHLHTPSEHTVAGKSFALENHLVHKNAKGELAVVGVLIEKGAENAAYKEIFANLLKKEEKKSFDVTINAAELLPKDKTYYGYAGSLTTPPCSEGVKWHVLKTPIQMSEAQIKAFSEIFKMNNRPVQPLGGRKITGDTVAK